MNLCKCPSCGSHNHMRQTFVLTYFRVNINGTDVPMFCESDMTGARTNAFDQEEVDLYFNSGEISGVIIGFNCTNCVGIDDYFYSIRTFEDGSVEGWTDSSGMLVTSNEDAG